MLKSLEDNLVACTLFFDKVRGTRSIYFLSCVNRYGRAFMDISSAEAAVANVSRDASVEDLGGCVSEQMM